MKHARKMVLVDIASVRPQAGHQLSEKTEDSLTKAINNLATSNEFSKANYGANAKPLSALDKELKELMDRQDLKPDDKLKLYDQKLQKYLFLLRDSNNAPNTKPKKKIGPSFEPSQPSPPSSPSSPTSDGSPPFEGFPSTKAVRTPVSSLLETPRTAKTPFYFTGRKPHKTNLPRTTPVHERIRTSAERQRNSRYKDFLGSWESYMTE